MGTASGAPTVLCAGDSLTANLNDWTNSYPAQLQVLRPDLNVVNGGMPGDVTWNFGRLDTLLDQYAPQVVVLMYGTNDVFMPDISGIPPPPGGVLPDAGRSIRNLQRMARLAHLRGAGLVIVLSQPPAICITACPPDTEQIFAERTDRTLAIDHGLFARRPGRWLTPADLRDAMSLWWLVETLDGLHPNVAGNARIAAFVSKLIPAQP